MVRGYVDENPELGHFNPVLEIEQERIGLVQGKSFENSAKVLNQTKSEKKDFKLSFE